MSKVDISYGTRQFIDNDLDNGQAEHFLIVNGQSLSDSDVHSVDVFDEDKGCFVVLSAQDKSELNDLITSLTFSQLPDNWHSLTIPLTETVSEYFENVEVRLILDAEDVSALTLPNSNLSPPCLYFEFRAAWHEWSYPWSISDYGKRLEQVVENKKEDLLFSKYRGAYKTFGLFATIRTLDNTICHEANFRTKQVQEIVNLVESQLHAQSTVNSFVTRFSFPPTVKTACEQYLLYFVQFLSDMGIEAEANINHQAQDVLFSVTPKDKDQALSTIQDALTVYLCIPSSPTFAADAALSNDIAVRQLEANVYHLKGQLALNQSILQAKDAAIGLLELTNFQQQQMLEAAAYNAKPIKSENESVMDGILEATPYEGKGFKVNVPEIVRRLKRRFNQP